MVSQGETQISSVIPCQNEPVSQWKFPILNSEYHENTVNFELAKHDEEKKNIQVCFASSPFLHNRNENQR